MAALIRAASIVDKGVLYDQGGFDDAVRYLDSARVFSSTGAISFSDTPHSAYQMPGYAVLLALFFRLSSNPLVQVLLIKIFLLVVSVASIYVLYLIGKRVDGVRVGLVSAALLTFSLPHIYTGNLTLSENPFTLGLLAMTLLVIRMADRPSWRAFFALMVVSFASLYVKQAAVGLVVPALVYLLIRRYPRSLLLRQAGVAIAIGLIVLAPWWVRNYQVFGTFVPFTSMDGAPFFEGTFQRFQPYGSGSMQAIDELKGKGWPASEVDRNRILADAGRARIRGRWSADPQGVLLSYTVMKPAAAWLLPFYWDRVFGISGYWVLRIHAALSVLGLVLLGLFSVRSSSRAEFLFFFMNVGVITVGAAYYLGLSRYVYPFMPFLYVAIAYLVDRTVSALRHANGVTGAEAQESPS